MDTNYRSDKQGRDQPPPASTGVSRWRAYPMGPKTRDYLGLTDEPSLPPVYSDEEAKAFTAFLRGYHASRHDLELEAAIDLLDELVTMDLPQAALDLASAYPETAAAGEFRAHLSIGVAAMLTGDLGRAEDHLRGAQGILPAEPAPYINLAQIFLSQNRLDEAELWATSGLDAEPNNFALWDQLALVLRDKHGELMPDYLMAFAEKRVAWAGLSLAANLVTTGDRYLKANLLEKLYHQGERDPMFLVELTGAYGIANDFAKIPPLVWQAERLASKGLPWQLHVHCAQAQLALNEPDAALVQLEKALRQEKIPDAAKAGIAELMEEAREGLKLGKESSPHSADRPQEIHH